MATVLATSAILKIILFQILDKQYQREMVKLKTLIQVSKQTMMGQIVIVTVVTMIIVKMAMEKTTMVVVLEMKIMAEMMVVAVVKTAITVMEKVTIMKANR